MRSVAFGLALAAGIVALVMVLRGGVAEREAPKAAGWAQAQPAGRLSPETVLAIAPGAPVGAGAARPAPRVSALLADFAAAADYRPLYDRLSQSPARTPEEDWLLARISDLCSRAVALRRGEAREGYEEALEQAIDVFAASLAEGDAHRARRIAAFERLTADRCARMPAVRVAPARIRALYEHAAQRGDPKARMELALLDMRAQQSNPYRARAPGGHVRVANDAHLDVLKAALESGDPQALLLGAEALVDPAGAVAVHAGAARRPVDPHAFRGAAALLACDLGYPCGAGHETLLRACALRGQCEARDLREHLLYYALSPHQSQLMLEYHAALARVAAARDWSFFVVARAAPPAR